MAADRYPLSWPGGWKRIAPDARRRAQFGMKAPGCMKRRMTIAAACDRLTWELKRLGAEVDTAILSTNIRVRFNGSPRGDDAEPRDPGAAVYFNLAGADRVLACDTWNRVADNITAIAAHVEAIRAIDRYGVGSVEQAFAGYVGLPPKGATWRTTLGFEPTQAVSLEEVEQAFKGRARDAHPDVKGGSHDAMASLTAARADARKELGA